MRLRAMVLMFCLIGQFCSVCLNADDWKRIYLASYPCSGNHWFRYLYEEVTGVATGSVYRDKDMPIHLPKPFDWGGFAAENGYEGNRAH